MLIYLPSQLTANIERLSWELREKEWALLKVIQNLCVAVLSRGPFGPPLAIEGVQRKLIEMPQLGASNYMGRKEKKQER